MTATRCGNGIIDVLAARNSLLSEWLTRGWVVDRYFSRTTIDKFSVDVILIVGFWIKGIDRRPPWSILAAL